MKTRHTLTLAITLGVLALVQSCVNAPHLKPGYVPPEEAVNAYLDSLRWQEYDEAKASVAPSAQPAFDNFRRENEGRLNLVDYKIRDVEMRDNTYTAVVKIRRSYFKVPSVSEQTQEITQTWKLIDVKWYLSGPPF